VCRPFFFSFFSARLLLFLLAGLLIYIVIGVLRRWKSVSINIIIYRYTRRKSDRFLGPNTTLLMYRYNTNYKIAIGTTYIQGKCESNCRRLFAISAEITGKPEYIIHTVIFGIHCEIVIRLYFFKWNDIFQMFYSSYYKRNMFFFSTPVIFL